MPVIVIIEDDVAVRRAVARGLADRGHQVDTEATGMAGLNAVVSAKPDAVVLDLGLPDVDGADVLQMIRAVSDVPVIVATARDDEAGMVHLLDRGADDYVVKPYSAAQLDARIRAVLRRGNAQDRAAPLVLGGLRVEPDARTASLDGEALDLSRKEFDVLRYLAERAGTVVSKRELLAEVWRQPYGGADKTVDVHLSWLRRKMGETAAEPRFIRTIRGVGVKLVDPDAAE
jgi:DNA-binding response OmpR family regulator